MKYGVFGVAKHSLKHSFVSPLKNCILKIKSEKKGLNLSFLVLITNLTSTILDASISIYMKTLIKIKESDEQKVEKAAKHREKVKSFCDPVTYC